MKRVLLATGLGFVVLCCLWTFFAVVEGDLDDLPPLVGIVAMLVGCAMVGYLALEILGVALK